MQIYGTPAPHPGAISTLLIKATTSLRLEIGEVVKAEVLAIADNAVSVRIKNSVVKAKTDLSLKIGESILLRVEGRENEVRLRFLGRAEENLSSLKDTILSALNALKTAKPALQDLKTLGMLLNNTPQSVKEAVPELKVLEAFLASSEKLSGAILKETVQNSGVYLETKLRLQVVQQEAGGLPGGKSEGEALIRNDAKAALLKLGEALQKPDVAEQLQSRGIDAQGLRGAVENLLKNIEVSQLQSKLNDSLHVFLPFVWKELKDGEFIFRETEQGGRGERSHSCTLNLDLERAGKVSSHVLFLSGQVHVNITTENGAFSDLLERGAEMLRSQFASAGLSLGSLRVRHEPKVDFNAPPQEGLSIKV